MEDKPQRAAGGIVLGAGGTVALVRHRGSDLFLFPKGRVESGEEDETAALRHAMELTGLPELEYVGDLGEYTRPSIADPEAQKTIRMFLYAAPQNARRDRNYEIEEVAWVPYRDVAERAGNVKDRAWYASVFERVREAVQRD